LKLICIGDSLTFGFKMTRDNTWPQIIEENLNINVINKGICGDTTGGMLSRFGRDVLDEKPTHVLIMGGSNDLVFGVPKSVIYSNLATMVYQAYHYRIQPIIGVPIPIIPSIAKETLKRIDDDLQEGNKEILLLRNWILHFSSTQQCEVIDFFNEFYNPINKMGNKDLYIDGVHPTIEGNKKMAQLVSKHIQK